MTTVVSDEGARDNQFNGHLLDTDSFPTATLILTSPIELSSVPQHGATVTAAASGDLTLRGVTNPVTFDVEARRNGDAIQVVGHTDITFTQYEIPQPDAPGITTQDHGFSSSVSGSTGRRRVRSHRLLGAGAYTPDCCRTTDRTWST